MEFRAWTGGRQDSEISNLEALEDITRIAGLIVAVAYVAYFSIPILRNPRRAINAEAAVLRELIRNV